MTDKEIREMLLSAEEPVSPGVWNAVAKGLDSKKAVVPFWMWSAVAVAAAAAVVLGIFLFRPKGQSLEDFTPGQSLIAQVSQESLSQDIVVPARNKVVRAPKAPVVAVEAAPSEQKSLEAYNSPSFSTQAVWAQSSRLAAGSKPVYVPTYEDNELLNQLAFEEEETSANDFSIYAAGNMQAAGKGHAYGRRAAAAANEEGEHISNVSNLRSALPLSASIGLRVNLNKRLSLGTGVRYTYRAHSFVGDYYSGNGYVLKGQNIDNAQHWIGIPLNLYYDFVNTRLLKVHAFGGGAADYLLDNKFTIHADRDMFMHKRDTRFQWSANVGAGVEFMITPWMGLFLDPSLRYYFGQAGADVNGLPAEPFRFVVEAGLRFNL